MISSTPEYQKAREELDFLGRWLARLETKEGKEFKSLTAASIRKMISRIQDEVAQYEGTFLSIRPRPPKEPGPDDSGPEQSG